MFQDIQLHLEGSTQRVSGELGISAQYGLSSSWPPQKHLELLNCTSRYWKSEKLMIHPINDIYPVNAIKDTKLIMNFIWIQVWQWQIFFNQYPYYYKLIISVKWL